MSLGFDQSGAAKERQKGRVVDREGVNFQYQAVKWRQPG